MPRHTRSKKPSLFTPCRTPDALWQWLRDHLELQLPRIPVCPGHAAPFDYLASAYFEPAHDAVVWAPRGGGKTRLGAVATLLDLLHKPGISVRLLGGSLEQSFRMWEHLLPDVETLADSHITGRPRSRRITLDNGALAAVATQSQRAVRGLRVQKLRCDEVELFDPAVWQAAQLVTRSRASESSDFPLYAGVVEALSTFHVPSGLMDRIIERASLDGTRIFKWCLLEVLARCEPDRDCHACPLFEECQGRAKTLCSGFVPIDDAIRMKRRVSLETWQAEMLCQRPSVEGRVFPTFDPAIHVQEDFPPFPAGTPHAAPPHDNSVWLALDFGYRAPFVCLWIRRDSRGRCMVIDEYLQSGRIIQEHLAQIASRPHGPIRAIACDPAGGAPNEQTGQSTIDALRAARFRVLSRQSFIVEGLELIRAALCNGAGEASLFFHPRCQHLIKAMSAYHYGPHTGETPEKDGTHDHPIDALRYYFVNARRATTKSADY